jgi:proteasome lid subunit RPN8/RPN11
MSELATDLVQISRRVCEALLAQARSHPLQECCGLLAGRGGVITAIFPANNVLQSAKAYEIAPEELFALFRRMRSEGLEHLGIYHSHPSGDNVPSPRDIERAFYPAVAYFIISPRPDAPRPVRAFRICEGQSRELIVKTV